ncbi:MAG TPA: histidine kinase [Pyrinomonadaceae bacterium]
MAVTERTRSRWTTALLVVSVFTLKLLLLLPQVYFYNLRSPEPLPWGQLLAKLALGTYSWAALVPPILFVSRRWKVERRDLPRRLLIHFGFGVLFAAAQTTLYHFGLTLIGDARDSFNEVPRLVGPWSFVFNGVLAYASIVAVHQAVLHFREAQEREFRLQQSQLQLLKTQLQPHFLFNTLNTIAQLINENPEAAEKMVMNLSGMLRFSLAQMGEQEVPLARELEFVNKYLEVMQERFGGRLNFRMEIDPRALRALVPPMILQPLVENSIRHGLRPREAGGHVEISAGCEGETLHLCVADNGCGIEGVGGVEASAIEGHVGLANTRARLDYLYGKRHRFELTSVPGRGVRVRMSLPLRDTQES